ncbi:molybdopterin-binding oxidoreductase [Phenylobacterium sp.]|uniref:molybdopterin-binding oxidoreductase n=1 Tax=Phenylobacterium sp. TaxID=1871053 RepID=UPI00286E180B|nr:molybdopterin-binding oxidoreductase [Phenylobacterium sp.]
MGLAGLAFAAALACAPATFAQSIALVGPDGQTATLNAADLAALPHLAVTVKQHDKTRTYEGALLGPIIAKVGAASGKAIHGAELATVIRISAADGYQVVLGLAETDPGTRSGRIILADRADGAALTKDGPFRLVVEDDLRPARSAMQVVKIEVLRLSISTPKPHH